MIFISKLSPFPENCQERIETQVNNTNFGVSPCSGRICTLISFLRYRQTTYEGRKFNLTHSFRGSQSMTGQFPLVQLCGKARVWQSCSVCVEERSHESQKTERVAWPNSAFYNQLCPKNCLSEQHNWIKSPYS